MAPTDRSVSMSLDHQRRKWQDRIGLELRHPGDHRRNPLHGQALRRERVTRHEFEKLRVFSIARDGTGPLCDESSRQPIDNAVDRPRSRADQWRQQHDFREVIGRVLDEVLHDDRTAHTLANDVPGLRQAGRRHCHRHYIVKCADVFRKTVNIRPRAAGQAVSRQVKRHDRQTLGEQKSQEVAIESDMVVVAMAHHGGAAGRGRNERLHRKPVRTAGDPAKRMCKPGDFRPEVELVEVVVIRDCTRRADGCGVVRLQRLDQRGWFKRTLTAHAGSPARMLMSAIIHLVLSNARLFITQLSGT